MPSPLSLERRPVNRWDSFSTDEFRHRVWLFGSQNIGRIDHCNMDVPGTLSPDLTTVIEHVYARTEAAPRDLVAKLELHQWASHAVVRLLVGDKPRRSFALSDLLQERPWEPAAAAIAIAREMEGGDPAAAEMTAAYQERLEQRRGEGPPGVEVPCRQYVAVDIEAPDWPPGPPTRIWIHLEGFQIWPGC